jgi:hypothetical protein
VPGPALAFLEANEQDRLYITFTVAGELAAYEQRRRRSTIGRSSSGPKPHAVERMAPL